MTQKNLLIALITLIVAIFMFAQVYILFAVSQTNSRLVQMETRQDKRFAEMEARIDKRFNEVNQQIALVRDEVSKLNQNYIDHLAHHIGTGGRK